ncbi:hypothetical protein GGX14DRAFT_583941 [Mycena pura]|uniref:Uncharacterized protein n=1 Tax=Mycena pura TaxID=153505 RepID=A0AAD6YWH2_9AGAR|nr:hypothetical protein GGX14DRAFT_583941 [Mycena pura]
MAQGLGLGPLGSSSSSLLRDSFHGPSRSPSLAHSHHRPRSTSSLSTRTSASDLAGFGMQDDDSGLCPSPLSPFLSNPDFGSPTGWPMGSVSPDPLVSKVERLSVELGNVKASLSPLDSKLDQLLDLLRSPRDPKHAAWIHEAGIAFQQQSRIAPGSPQLAELQRTYPEVQLWDVDDFKETKDDVRRVSKGGGTDKKNDINNSGRFIEYAKGGVIGGKEFGDINASLNLLLNDIYAAGKAPARLRDMGHEVTSAIVFMLEKEFPYLSLCSNHWKAKRVIAGRYRFWAKTQGLGENGDGSDSDDERVVGSKHKARATASASARKRAKPAVVPAGLSSSLTPTEPPSASLLPSPVPALAPVPAPTPLTPALAPSSAPALLAPFAPAPPPLTPPPLASAALVPSPVPAPLAPTLLITPFSPGPAPPPASPPPLAALVPTPAPAPLAPFAPAPPPHSPPPLMHTWLAPAPAPFAPAPAPPVPAPNPAPVPALAPTPAPLDPPPLAPAPVITSITAELDIFAGIDVAPPAPPPVTTTTPAPAPVVSKAGAKEASPSPTTLTARNLCLAVWCAESGGPVASFTVYWDGIKKDKKLLQAYENCAKNLKKNAAKTIPEVGAIREAVGLARLGPAAETSGSSLGREGEGDMMLKLSQGSSCHIANLCNF